eukprot:TRINITY_DN3820_c0_g1_i1.p1 TRINITY_DN3820_c0_g1~~TRINITY_DN3820_c0_g1_i1.p1  ORF type:complete len:615 (-),score=87.33 TRINITY_DN3820_c0_g1_i1:1538-3382(-)
MESLHKSQLAISLGVEIWRIALLVISSIGIVVIIINTKVHPFLVLLGISTIYGSVTDVKAASISKAIKEGFGEVLGELGPAICSSLIIGLFMTRSNALYKLSQGLRDLAGTKNVPAIMSTIGFIFAAMTDAPIAFLLLCPFMFNYIAATEVEEGPTIISMALSMTAAGAVVPPAPGPVEAADKLETYFPILWAYAVPIAIFQGCLGWIWGQYVVEWGYPKINGIKQQTNIKKQWKHKFFLGLNYQKVQNPAINAYSQLHAVKNDVVNHLGKNVVSWIEDADDDKKDGKDIIVKSSPPSARRSRSRSPSKPRSRSKSRSPSPPVVLQEEEPEPVENPPVAPHLLLCLLPILIPAVLMCLGGIARIFVKAGFLFDLMTLIGQPVIAMIPGMLIAFTLPDQKSIKHLSHKGWVGKAFKLGADVAFVLASGGIFGKMMYTAGIHDIIISGEGLYQASAGLFVPSVVALVAKFVYGSTKLAMVNSALIILPLLAHLELNDDRTLVCTAIGTGTSVFSFVSDDFFWMISRLTNMDMKNMLIFYTGGSIVTGGAGTILVYLTGFNLVVGGGIMLATFGITIVLVVRRQRRRPTEMKEIEDAGLLLGKEKMERTETGEETVD